MSGRYRESTSGMDAGVLSDGDTGFAGVDMRRDPTLLPAGVASLAVNVVFRQGVAEPRKGFQTRAWGTQLGVDFPLDFDVDFTIEQGFGEVFGAGVFADPNGQEYGILACETTAYRIAASQFPQAVRYPAGVSVTGPVTFTQAQNVLLMWRGEDLTPLALSTGTSFEEEVRFEEVPDETNEDYTSTIPGAKRGLHYGNRVWVGYERSKVAFSDILSYTRFDAALSTIYVNAGDDDTLQVLVPFGENAILAFKNQSIYAISNVLPDPTDAGTLQAVTFERGTVAPESVVQVGRDVWFLSDDGVYAVSQALDNKLQAASEPVSAPMQPLFDRVNWAAASRAVGIYHESKYLLAMPIDGAEHNNCLVVYDFLNQGWSGWWEFDWLDAAFMLRLTVAGRRRLVVVTGTALPGNAGMVFVLGDDYADERLGDEATVETELLTRGYLAGTTASKTWTLAMAEVATWFGAGSLSAVRDGVNEEAQALTFTKDRTRYAVHGKGAYDESNADGSHGDPYREDYSVEATTDGFYLGTEGTAFGLHQLSSERLRIRQPGRHVQVRIRGTRGRVVVRAVTVEARGSAEPRRMKV